MKNQIKLSIALLTVLSLNTTLLAENVIDYQSENKTTSFSVDDSDGAYEVKGSFDLGLGDNLLEGLAAKRDKELDKIFNPLIEKLEKWKKRNMKLLNTDNLGNMKEGVESKWMSYIGFDDFKKAADKFKNKYKNEEGDSIFGAQEFYQESNGLNPFNHFREKLKESEDKVKQKINDFDVLSDNTREKLAKYSEKISKYTHIDSDKLVTDYVMKGKEMKQGSFGSYMKDLASGKNSGEMLMDFYQKQYPDYVAEKSSTVFKLPSILPKTNNLCDITKCLYSKSCIDPIDGHDLKKEYNKKLKELKEKMLVQGIYLATTTLMKEFAIMEYVDYAQKAMSCSVEATVSTLQSSLGIPDFFSTAGAVTLLNGAGDKAKNSTKTGEDAPTVGSAVAKNNQKVADCLKIDDTIAKSTKNIDGDVGLVEQQADTTVLSEFDVMVSIFIPFTAPGGDVKVSSSSATSKIADKAVVKQCIEEGKTDSWKASFNACMEAKSDSNYDFKQNMDFKIKKLFGKMRKHKKVQCILKKNTNKREKLNFSLLKYTAMLPSAISTQYNSTPSTTNNPKKALEAVKLLLEKKIPVIANKDNKNTICLESYLEASKEGIKPLFCEIKVKGSDIDGSIVDNLLDFDKKVNKYCSGISNNIINAENKLDSYKKAFKNDTQDTDLEENISGLSYCMKYYKIKSFKLLNSGNTKANEDTKISYMLEMKYRDEEDVTYSVDIEAKTKLFEETFKKLDMLSETELYNVCVVNPPRESKTGLKSPVYYYCKSFKTKLFDKVLNQAKNEFDFGAFDFGATSIKIKSIEKRIQEVKTKYRIK